MGKLTLLTEKHLQQIEDGTVDWKRISRNQTLSEAFIREFADKVHWPSISIYQKLSEDFIREFADKVEWVYICTDQNLSEDFIREFADRVNWWGISHSGAPLSEEFIREFIDKLDWERIRYRYKSRKYKSLSKAFTIELQLKGII